jgi:hypothetical protein
MLNDLGQGGETYYGDNNKIYFGSQIFCGYTFSY